MASDTKKKQTQTAKEEKPVRTRKTTTTKTTTAKKQTQTGPARKPAGSSKVEKKTGGKTNTKKAETKRPEEESDLLDFPILDEVVIWLSLALCVILMISVFGFGGTVGGILQEFLFGVFGFLAYLVPVLLFFLIAFLVSNHGSILAWIKACSAMLLYFALCAIVELITNKYLPSRTFLDYYTDSARYQSGGGLAGGLLASMFCPALGVAGAYVVLIILIIICLIMITERSLLNGVKKGSKKVVQTAMDDATIRRERAEIRKERQRVRREQEREMEKRYLEEEKQRLAQVQKENASSAKIVNDFLLNDPKAPQVINLEEVREVIPPPLTGVKAEKKEEPEKTEKYVFGEKPKKRPAFQPEPLNLEPVEAEPLALDHEEHQEPETPKASKTPETPVFSEDFQIQRGETHAAFESGFGSELVRMGKERAKQEETGQSETGVPEMEIFPETEAVSGGNTENEGPKPEEDPYEDIPPSAQVPEPERAPSKNPKSSKKEQEQGIAEVAAEIQEQEQEPKPEYVFPPLNLLKAPKGGRTGDSDETLRSTARKLQQTLHNFGVEVTVSNVSCGPSVTRYELTPEQGVRVSKIVNLADDIKLNLAAADIRIEAPIPGKMAVGIEVPNKENSTVPLRELLETKEFQNHPSNLAFAAGKDIGGKAVVTDIAKMPHLLIAGATGSGKSVCINTIIMSILYKASPEDVKLIMIDPKVVELSVYNGIPHLFIPVVTDPKKAAGALNWAVAEMTDRYNKFAEVNVRDLKGYNAKIEALEGVEGIDEEEKPKKLPQIVIIVDELADLMMVAPGEVEDAICRLAQLARAAGIHLIIATQRPSVNVITGLIKANMPSRIAFAVSSGVDSRTIIDMNGAEKLLGKGDMLFYPQGYQKPARVQGAFVSDEEVGRVVEFLAGQNQTAVYSKDVAEKISKASLAGPDGSGGAERDALFQEAGKFIIEKDKASIGMLQRMFKIGFNRAARIMDQLADAGVVGEEEGTKPRKVLMSMEQFENYVDEYI
ncbi:MAG: DNA translocase FtsK 4TM domain-containing protein [Eubacteriales bacterium]|nr:DNA translocase FtsK 4TM domain-containing protein [Eubacteriales bacterium]